MHSAAKRTGTSVFQSRVTRSNLNTAAAGPASTSYRARTKTKQGFFQNKGRPSTTQDTIHPNIGGALNAIAQDRDIFDDDFDEDPPGPGQYYNSAAHTSFKPAKVPERLQFFGSTVERLK